jgi:hypothetical protein
MSGKLYKPRCPYCHSELDLNEDDYFVVKNKYFFCSEEHLSKMFGEGALPEPPAAPATDAPASERGGEEETK